MGKVRGTIFVSFGNLGYDKFQSRGSGWDWHSFYIIVFHIKQCLHLVFDWTERGESLEVILSQSSALSQ